MHKVPLNQQVTISRPFNDAGFVRIVSFYALKTEKNPYCNATKIQV